MAKQHLQGGQCLMHDNIMNKLAMFFTMVHPQFNFYIDNITSTSGTIKDDDGVQFGAVPPYLAKIVAKLDIEQRTRALFMSNTTGCNNRYDTYIELMHMRYQIQCELRHQRNAAYANHNNNNAANNNSSGNSNSNSSPQSLACKTLLKQLATTNGPLKLCTNDTEGTFANSTLLKLALDNYQYFTKYHVTPNTSAAFNVASMKLVFVGDPQIGKTSLMCAYHCLPKQTVLFSIYDGLTTQVTLQQDRTINVGMWDIKSYQFNNFDRLKKYDGTTVFVLCYSIVDPQSFKHIEQHWVHEIEYASGYNGCTKVLVGLKSDLRNHQPTLVKLASQEEQFIKCKQTVPVSYEQGYAMATRLGCQAFIETSELKQENLSLLFKVLASLGMITTMAYNEPINKNCSVM